MKVRTVQLTNFLIIRNASINPHAGVNVITGETGSGKSLFVSAFNLLCGGRASSDFIGKWGDSGGVTAVIDISDSPGAASVLDEHALRMDDEPDRLIVRRLIGARNRCYINDVPVSLQMLRDVMDGSVEVSSQFENRELYRRDYQTRILDTLGSTGTVQERYGTLYEQMQEVRRGIAELTGKDEPGRRDYLAYQIDEIDENELKLGEDVELESAVRLRDNAQRIREHLGAFCESADAAVVQLETAAGHARDLTGYLNDISDVAERVDSAHIEMADISRTVSGRRDEFDEDMPDEDVVERFDLLNRLCMKHSVDSVDDLLAYREEMMAERAELECIPKRVRELRKQAANLEKKLFVEAETLHSIRTDAAEELDSRITGYLEQFGMRHVKFRTDVEKTDEPGPTGCDHVTFTINTTGGDTMHSLRTLSGGELSRFLLSLKLIDNEQGKILLFDEIDANIGGEVARRAAAEIKRSAGRNQVFVVTHFPQTAATGDRHFVIEKDSGAEVRSRLRGVTGTARERELARMLGDADGDEQKMTAQRLLRS